MKILSVILLGGLLYGTQVASVAAEPAPDIVVERWDVTAEAIRLHLDLEAAELMVAGRTLNALETLRQFYVEREFRPAWTDHGRLPERSRQLIQLLADTQGDGLRPADYHLDAIQGLSARLGKEGSIQAAGQLDLLLSDAFVTLAGHLRGGRVDPASVDADWTLERPQSEPLTELSAAVAGEDPAGHLRGLFPGEDAYQGLRLALTRYRDLAAAGGWPLVDDGPKLEPGAEDARVPVLRARLEAEFGPVDEPEVATDLYSPALVAAVREFQRRNGLLADGIVGANTLSALNVSADERVRQLLVNLERWRWMHPELGDRYIRVNVADYTMELVERGRPVIRRRVIVGKEMNATPVFSGRMTYMVINPTWEVPKSIAVKEILPRLKRDPGYLQKHNMVLLRGWGANEEQVDTATVDFKRLSENYFPYRVRQLPGPNNALGRVKFIFPNNHAVYLHDTPSRGLFGRSKRAFSHGCVRVEKPLELAEWLLTRNGRKPDRTLIPGLLQTGEQQKVRLPRAVPVHLQYWTAWADEDGSVHFREDIYGRDQRLMAALDGEATKLAQRNP